MSVLHRYKESRYQRGLCAACGKVPYREGRRMCQECADKASAINEVYRAQLKRGRKVKTNVPYTYETAVQAQQVSPGKRCHCMLLLPCNDHSSLTTEYYSEQRRNFAWVG